MSKETWESIAGYEHLYEVSDQGRVRSCDRIDACNRLRLGRLLALSKSGVSGYLTVGLSKKGEPRTHTVHSLVLTAFSGTKKTSMVGCHSDGDRHNNNILNLRWDTQKGNLEDRKEHGTHRFGENHPMAKLCEREVILIRDGNGTRNAKAQYFGVSRACVDAILARRTWNHI